jgi:hypothetical protein
MGWIVFEWILFCLFVPIWLLLMFVSVRFALPDEPTKKGRLGFALVVVAVNIFLIGFILYHGYLLLAESGMLVKSETTAQQFETVQAILGLVALPCLGIGGWLRIRETVRSNRTPG